ncbi:hypothetical protein D3C85_1524330 [compost metagenome]
MVVSIPFPGPAVFSELEVKLELTGPPAPPWVTKVGEAEYSSVPVPRLPPKNTPGLIGPIFEGQSAVLYCCALRL